MLKAASFQPSQEVEDSILLSTNVVSQWSGREKLAAANKTQYKGHSTKLVVLVGTVQNIGTGLAKVEV